MSTQLWLTYFSLNAVGPRDIPWGAGPDLPAGEAPLIVPSVQEFQIGESSSGDRLRRAAAAWAARHQDEDLGRVIDLLIAEEQRHAAELARFLRLNGHPTRSRTGGDAVFRVLRHLTGRLEVSLTVLMTAEIIGYVYYGALRNATSSALLRSLCGTFLRDEAAHLLFHADQLARMRRGRPRTGIWLTHLVVHGLMGGACAVVWARHRAVLRRGGLTFMTFLAGCRRRLVVATRTPGRAGAVATGPEPAGAAG